MRPYGASRFNSGHAHRSDTEGEGGRNEASMTERKEKIHDGKIIVKTPVSDEFIESLDIDELKAVFKQELGKVIWKWLTTAKR